MSISRANERLTAVIDAEKGQRAYRISTSSPTRTYYRELEVVRVTPKQIIAKTKWGQELRFWRKNGYEVGFADAGFLAYYTSKLGEGDHYVEAGCDRGRSW